MFNTLTELFLQTYFQFDNVAGKLIGDTKLLFDKLFSVFLLPEEERERLFALTQRDEVREIETYGDYAQVCRIQKYAEIAEIDSGIGADVKDVIAIKGGALLRAKQFESDEYPVSTETSVCQFLTDSANMGLISSLCALGFLQSEGIFVEKNCCLGSKNLERAAKWNSIEGLLLALFYNEKNRNRNLDRLYTVTRGLLHEEIYAVAAAAYGRTGSAQLLPETKLLAKSFGTGILKPEVYIPQYARFIYSEVLGVKDKERALFSGHKEAIAETAELPLKLAYKDVAFDGKTLCDLPFVHQSEYEKICHAVRNADMRRDGAYRPLCICADSDYLLKCYLSAMSKAFLSAHIERIDVSDLNEYDFEPTKNNVFVRSCDEDRQNVYALYFKGDVREPILYAVKGFLQAEKRKKFRLQHPAATIDLSAVLPVCFCDRQNARLLKQYCDVVTLAPVSVFEKPNVLAYILQKKAERYKLKSLQTDAYAQKFLTECSIDRAESLVDMAVRFHRDIESLTITADMLKELSRGEPSAKTRYGFGGADNESK